MVARGRGARRARTRRRREEIDARNELDSLAYRAGAARQRAAGPRCPSTRRRGPSSSWPTLGRRSPEQAGLDRRAPADRRPAAGRATALPAAASAAAPTGGNGAAGGRRRQRRRGRRRGRGCRVHPRVSRSRRSARTPTPSRSRARGRRRRRAARARGPLQAGACRPRQLPQALRIASSSARAEERTEALTARVARGGRQRRARAAACRRDRGHDRRRACAPCASRWTRSSRGRGVARIGAARRAVRPRAARGGRHGRRPTSPRPARSPRSCGPGTSTGDRVLRPAAGDRRRTARADGRRLRDYYEVLGRRRGREPGGHPARLPPARPREPPGRQQGAGAPRIASRRSPRPTRCCATRRSESATTASAPTSAGPRGRRSRGVGRAPRRGAGGGVRDGRDGRDGGFGDGAASATSSSATSADLLGELFGGGRRGRGLRRRAAPTTRPTLELSLEEAARGGRRTISLGRRPRAYEVDIPPGVRDGQRIRLAGQGGQRRRRRPRPATCSCACSSQPHPRFRVEGRDLHIDASGRAVGGGARRRPSRLPTLDGEAQGAGAARLVERAASCGCAGRAARSARRAGRPLRRGPHRGPEEAQPTRSGSCSSELAEVSDFDPRRRR